ncbi:MAG: cation:proton antiporter [Candidatus Tectomicrobia bacterium]|nr:cation:proton antiporter [Candidatus Tectomicrobia bacterium]
MHDLPILRELVIVLGTSLAISYLLHRIRVPTMVGFLAAGVLIGPGGLGLVRDPRAIQGMAEIGVVLLLFVIGLKFSLAGLFRMRSTVLGAGALQVALTVAAAAGAARVWGLPPAQAILWGFLAALSSTAILLKAYEERGEIDSPQGRLAVGILLFQDLAVIPMMLLIPWLGGSGPAGWGQAAWALATSVALLAGFLFAARFLFPWLLERAECTRSGEIFMLAVVLTALGTAYLAGLGGISLALGAFLAGMVISESEYSYQIVSEVAPFRDIFTSLFFVSIGMLVEPALWWSQPLATGGLALAVMAVKGLIVALVALALGAGPRVALLAALALGQIGEFSFVLAQAGTARGLMEPGHFRLFLAASITAMALTPFAIQLSDFLAGRLFSPRLDENGRRQAAPPGAGAHGHVVIVGYGLNGRNVANLLAEMQAPYAILDLNPVTVRRLRRAGEWVIFGDAARRPVLLQAGVRYARALVVSTADPAACRQIAAQARELNPSLAILVRTRYSGEIAELHRLGAEEVVADEFEASLALAGRLMALYGTGGSEIAEKQASIRSASYQLLRKERKGI